VPIGTSPQQWADMLDAARQQMGNSWGDVVSFLDDNTVQVARSATQIRSVGANALVNAYGFDEALQYDVGVYGAGAPATQTPPFPVVAAQGKVKVYNAHQDAGGNPVALDPTWPTFVLVHGLNGYRMDFGTLAQVIANDSYSFPSGHVNVLVATWDGAASGPV